MVESYQHLRALPDLDYAERKIPVTLQPGKKYKALVRKESIIAKLIKFPNKVEALLTEHYKVEDEYTCKRCYKEILDISEEDDIDGKVEGILQGAIRGGKLETAKHQFIELVLKAGYARKGQSYWKYMRYIFRQIIFHNLCKANRIQYGEYQLEYGRYKDCFEQLDLNEILTLQNMVSKDNEEEPIQAIFYFIYSIARPWLPVV